MLLKRKKLIFNLHLILSLLAALPLLIIVASAPFVSYRAELAKLINTPKTMLAPSQQPNLSVDEILTKLREQTGFEALVKLDASAEQNTAWHASVTKEGQNFSLFIDPRTGEVLGEDLGEKFSRTVLMLHRNLGLALVQSDENIAGKIGKQIVGASSMIMAFLALSGLWLYWPLMRKNFTQSLKFSAKARGYGFFYKFHASLGLWTSILMLVMSLTGLYWSYGWVKNGVNAAFGVQAQQGGMQHRRELPQPTDNARFAELDAAFKIFSAQNVGKFSSASLSVPKSGQIYTITYEPNTDKKALGKAQVDLAQNAITKDELQNPETQMTAGKRVSRTILSVHTGEILGEIGQLLFALACAVGVAVVVSGLMMTLRRVKK